MRRLLIVEDDHDIAEFLGEYFEQYYEVQIADHGEAGLRLVTEPDGKPFDIVLTDIIMQNLDGVSMAAEMKKRVGTLSIFAITGAPHLCRGRGDLFEQVFVKPFDFELVHRAVEKNLKD